MMLTQAKKELSEREYAIVTNDLERKGKKPWLAYLFWILLGGSGGQRFYLGDIGMGIAMLFLNWMTFGIWGIVDLFLINKRVVTKNEEIELELIKEVRNLRD